jgi:DNA-binding GntR family transcriptional regulator
VSASRRLQRRTTSDTVADELRAAIVRGDYQDGMELNQVDLAREFGVSRVPIREALRQLKAEGLITSEPHMRAAVVGHTLERVLEILDLRALMECYLLTRSATRMTAADIAELRAMCAKMSRARVHDDWLELNTQFHDRLYSHADAPVASDMVHQLTLRVQRYVRMVRSNGRKRTIDANAEHVAILDAIEKGDIETARSELEAHIQHTADQVRTIFAEWSDGKPADAKQARASQN